MLKFNNKKLIYASLGFIVIIFILWIVTGAKKETIKAVSNMDHQIELSGIRFIGYDNKRIAFNVTAESAWSGKDIEEAYLTNVTDGQVYNKKGRMIIKNIKAKRIYSNSRYDRIIAKNGMSAIFLPKAYAEEATSTLDTKIEAQTLRYDSKAKKTFIEGNIKITQEKTEIMADKANIENEDNIAYIEGNITLINKDIILHAEKMTSYLNDESSVVTGGVEMIWLAEPTLNVTDNRRSEIRSSDTTITCETVSYSSKDDIDMAELSGNIVVKQKGKTITGGYAFYDGRDKTFSIFNNVSLEMDSLGWLIQEKTRQNLGDKEAQNMLSEKTYITGDTIKFNKETKDVAVSGNVVVDQPKNEATADTLFYYDLKEEVLLSGNVSIRKKGKDWIKASRARMFLKDEIFEAMGGIETEFKMEKKDKE